VHQLRIIRESYGLTIHDLSVLSDISVNAITRIESGKNPYKTNEGVALALAHALDAEVCDIFDKTELSHLGRPPHTGKPIGTGPTLTLLRAHEMLCPDCFTAVPRAVGCDMCAA
jgi:transcriptional regulator with XRE-family HTH domain